MSSGNFQATAKILKTPSGLILTACGFGLSPIISGTVGTLFAIPLFIVMQPLGLLVYGLIVILFFAIGVKLSDQICAKHQLKDPSFIVWDEVVGYLVTMSFAPAGWLWILVGFFCFRLFDIWKPYPINVIDEEMAGGMGIMLDDVLAGVYAGILLYIIHTLYSY